MTPRTITAALLATLLLAAPFAASAIPEGPEYPSAEWTAREAANFARVSEAPSEQLAPDFQTRLQAQSVANQASLLQRSADDPSWLDPRSGNSNFSPLCTSWMQQCAGDPFRYPGTDPFYDTEGEVVPFVYYDAGCARISGRVWAPMGSQAGDDLPAVVIETGSVQAPEPLYWWMAQALVRAGYVTMTFDVRGQGRSDNQTPDGEQGGNANSAVFWDGLVNAIDFFRSSPGATYPHNAACAGTYATVVTDFNPFHDRIDPERFGIAGHSLGAAGVSVVQSYGATGADPWPGLIDNQNPVDVVVAWDSLASSARSGGGTPAIVPRVPAMGHTSEYSLTPMPKTAPPDPEGHKAAYAEWVAAGLPVFQITVQGSSHYEWSLIPTFPTTSWCPDPAGGDCAEGWGRPLGEHYSVAWFDRWLKQPGEPGFDDADARLLADEDWVERYSFYSRSARNFPSRDGTANVCEDIRAGCEAVTTPPDQPTTGTPPATAASSNDGGAVGWPLATLLLLAAALRRRQKTRRV